MYYHKTKDILHVKEVLITKTSEEVKLLEVGFEYICDMDETKFFRKRK